MNPSRLVVCTALTVLLAIPAAYAQTVGSDDIQRNAVLGRHVKKGVIKSSDIKNSTIKEKDLADGAVTATKLAPGVRSFSVFAGGEQNISVFPTHQVVRFVSMVAPADGTVVVSSSATAGETTAGDYVRCSITTSTVLDTNFLQEFHSAGDPGTWSVLAGVRGFDVLDGDTLIVNLVCNHAGASVASTIRDSSMIATFNPS